MYRIPPSHILKTKFHSYGGGVPESWVHVEYDDRGQFVARYEGRSHEDFSGVKTSDGWEKFDIDGLLVAAGEASWPYAPGHPDLRAGGTALQGGEEATSSFLQRVNQPSVSAELPGEVIEIHAATPGEDGTVFEVRAARLFEVLDRRDLIHGRGALATEIDFRLAALARLHSDDTLRGWLMPGGEPGMYIHTDLVRAAAEQPVIEDAAGQATFNPASFCRRVLANAESRGHA
jgi:hypothetical protein